MKTSDLHVIKSHYAEVYRDESQVVLIKVVYDTAINLVDDVVHDNFFFSGTRAQEQIEDMVYNVMRVFPNNENF